MFLIKKDWTISFSEIAEVSMVVFCLAFVVFLENVAILLISFSTTSLLSFCKIAELSFQMGAMAHFLIVRFQYRLNQLRVQSTKYHFENLPESFDY